MNQVYALGVDWSDEKHEVCVLDEVGVEVLGRSFKESADGFAELGCILDEWSMNDIDLVACIEKPDGRVIDLLLDHNVKLFPVNPKGVKGARNIHRSSGGRSDAFDAFVLADFIRTHWQTLTPILPNSPQIAELKILTRSYAQQMRHRNRLILQLRQTLKSFFRRPLEVFSDLSRPSFRGFLKQVQTPQQLEKLSRYKFFTYAKKYRLGNKEELWEKLKQPQLMVPEHISRPQARAAQTLLRELDLAHKEVEAYRKAIEAFFDNLPVAEIAKTLPGGKSGIMIPSLWAELGDGQHRWESFRHLQASSGAVPLTDQSGNYKATKYRFACNKRLRYLSTTLADYSIIESIWARTYYDQQKKRGKSHRQASRALASKWLKIIYVMWRDQVPYDENLHLANLYRQNENLR
jgi:hypothetical protein|tara:strand:- start:21 stop:1238 length:1218 start_codon:yes stop_codon:yes gene_type:complete